MTNLRQLEGGTMEHARKMKWCCQFFAAVGDLELSALPPGVLAALLQEALALIPLYWH